MVSNFSKLFDNVNDFNSFLKVNRVNCISYELLDNKILALFERADEVMLATKEGRIFYSGAEDFWSIAIAIESFIMDNYNSVKEDYGIDIENEIMKIGNSFLATYDLYSDDFDTMNRLIDDTIGISGSRVENWNARNEEFYYSLRELFEL